MCLRQLLDFNSGETKNVYGIYFYEFYYWWKGCLLSLKEYIFTMHHTAFNEQIALEYWVFIGVQIKLLTTI